MIYDCFIFFDELDLLEIRLHILNSVVDKFVIVEAGETHTGKPKPFYFRDNKARFSEFKDKIIYVGIDKFPALCKTCWGREDYQRNAMAEGLKSAKDDDIILISDLDEIPNPEKILKFAALPGVKAFDQTYYAFYLNYRNVRQQRWLGTRMVSYRDFCHVFDGVAVLRDEFLPEWVNYGTTASKIRCRKLPRSRGGQHIVSDGGWHFTCLGGAEAVIRKMRSVSPHHNFNPDDPSLTVEKVEALLAKGQGPALKMNCFGVSMDETFPKYLREHEARYAHLIFNVTFAYVRQVRWSRFFRTIQGYIILLCELMMPSWFHGLLHSIRMRWLAMCG